MVVNSVHWFRRGLRLHDNPALQEALNGADTVRCVYILDPWFAGSANVGVNRWRFVPFVWVFYGYKQAYVGKFGVIVKGRYCRYCSFAQPLSCFCPDMRRDSVCMVAGALLCHFKAILVQRSYLRTKMTFWLFITHVCYKKRKILTRVRDQTAVYSRWMNFKSAGHFSSTSITLHPIESVISILKIRAELINR